MQFLLYLVVLSLWDMIKYNESDIGNEMLLIFFHLNIGNVTTLTKVLFVTLFTKGPREFVIKHPTPMNEVPGVSYGSPLTIDTK